jgi:hypothetical protein
MTYVGNEEDEGSQFSGRLPVSTWILFPQSSEIWHCLTNEVQIFTPYLFRAC